MLAAKRIADYLLYSSTASLSTQLEQSFNKIEPVQFWQDACLLETNPATFITQTSQLDILTCTSYAEHEFCFNTEHITS